MRIGAAAQLAEQLGGRRRRQISEPHPPLVGLSSTTTSRLVRATDSSTVARSHGTSVRRSTTSASTPRCPRRREGECRSVCPRVDDRDVTAGPHDATPAERHEARVAGDVS